MNRQCSRTGLRAGGVVDAHVPVRSRARLARRSRAERDPHDYDLCERHAAACRCPTAGGSRTVAADACCAFAADVTPRRLTPDARAGAAGNLVRRHAMRRPGLPDARRSPTEPASASVSAAAVVGRRAGSPATCSALRSSAAAGTTSVGRRAGVGHAGRRPSALWAADARRHVGRARPVEPSTSGTASARSRTTTACAFRPIDLRRHPHRRADATGAAAAGLLAARAWLAGHVQPVAGRKQNARDLYDSAHGGWLVALVAHRRRRRAARRGADVPRAAAGRVRPPRSTTCVGRRARRRVSFALIHFRPVEYPGLFVFGSGARACARCAPAGSAWASSRTWRSTPPGCCSWRGCDRTEDAR